MQYVLSSKMEKLPMCRICLVENVRMYVVVNRNMQKLYEKLTDIPFVTEDSRPILACFICCTKLKQCCRFLRQCLEAEEQFARMMYQDYKPNPLLNQHRSEFYSGFIKSPIEYLSIVDECQTENITIKEELPAVYEGLDDIIEPKEEYRSHELKLENAGYSCLDVADIPLQHSESDLEDDVPLMEFKSEVVEEEVSKKKRRARETKRTTVAKKPKLDTRRTKLEEAIIAEQTRKEKSDSKIMRTTQQCPSKPGTYFNDPYKCDVCQRSFNSKSHFSYHIRTHTGEKPYKCNVCQRSFNHKSNLSYHIRIHTGEKPYKCDLCQRSFSAKCQLTNHIRIHTGEKPYKCDVCQRSFKQKSNLSYHIRKHTGEKPYKCDVCQRSFKQKYSLTNHIHTGEKPYKCDVCQRCFNQKNSLTNHIRIHSALLKEPYKYVICDRSFSENGVLNKVSTTHW